MSEQAQQNQKCGTCKFAAKRLWVIATVIVIAAVICLLFWKVSPSKRQTVDEQLAAIEADRAIPASENAATIYNHILETYDINSFTINFLDEQAEQITRIQPWPSKDYLELVKWLEDRQEIISRLIEASKIEKCRFPIRPSITQMPKPNLAAIRQWVFLLARAANNDIAEGRVDAALEKYICLIQLAKHIRQQPAMFDHLFGITVEAISLHAMASFIVQGDANEAHLKTIEAIPFQMKNTWSTDLTQMLEVERLLESKLRKDLSFIGHLRYWYWWYRYGLGIRYSRESLDRTHEIYLKLLTDRRGTQILTALRRCKNQTGHWPKNLDEIKPFAPAEIFVDPINGSSFVYKLADDSFKLYSKGENNIDEDGKRDRWDKEKTGADDWLIWPTKGRKTQKEKTDAEQP